MILYGKKNSDLSIEMKWCYCFQPKFDYFDHIFFLIIKKLYLSFFYSYCHETFTKKISDCYH